MNKKIVCLLPLLLAGCSSNVITNSDKTSDISNESESVETLSSKEEILDYGNVTFDDMQIFPEGYDGVKIRPYYSNAKVEGLVDFDYAIEDETICEIDEDNRVWFKKEGTTVVSVTSEKYETKTFSVRCLSKMVADLNANDFIFPVVKQMSKDVLNKYAGEETLFVGDSFFQFWRDGVGTTKFSEVFAEYSVFNIGVSGATSHDLRAMLNLTTALTNPKNIVINIGVNNVDDDNETGLKCFRNIKALVDDYLEMFEEANIYYLSITKCSGHFAFKWGEHNVSNMKMKEYCESNDRLHYLDINALYGNTPALYQSDGLHPNQAGYDLFEQIIKENVGLTEK